jgi:hypothetical protein
VAAVYTNAQAIAHAGAPVSFAALGLRSLGASSTSERFSLMHIANRIALLTPPLVATSLSMLSSDAVADIAGPGYGMMGHGIMYGFGWMWVPWLLVAVLGAAVVASMFRRR